MYVLTLIVFSLILSLVPFSVAVSSSVYRCIQWKEALLISLCFALFQVMMASLGWGIGYSVKHWLYDLTLPVAVFIMLFIGLRYFFDSRRKEREMRIIKVSSIRLLTGFALAISINTFLLSIGLGILYTGMINFMGTLFVIVFVMTILGIRAGKLGWINLGRIAETAGSLLLFGIGIFMFAQYLKLI